MAKRSPSGDGMVRKREDGRWEGRIVIGHKENGDPIFRYLYAETQKELTAKLRQNITAYQGVDLTEECRMTLSEWLDRWLEEYMAGRIRSTTMDVYRRDLDNHVKPYIGEKPLLKLSAEDLRSLYQTLMERGNRNKGSEHGTGLSPTTVRGVHNTLHHALKTAVEEGLLPVDPAASVTPPKVTHKAKTILNHEQLEILKSAVKRDEIWCDFFLTELTTGLRRGELCGLKWEDFDEAAGTLKICRTIRAKKGGGVEEGATKTYAGTRTILLPSSTDNLLRERKRSAVTQWIFPDPLRPERPVSPGSAYRRLKAILEETGLPDLRFHDLRHTFATHALANGVDAKTLSGILGHTKASFTVDTYQDSVHHHRPCLQCHDAKCLRPCDR